MAHETPPQRRKRTLFVAAHQSDGSKAILAIRHICSIGVNHSAGGKGSVIRMVDGKLFIANESPTDLAELIEGAV